MPGDYLFEFTAYIDETRRPENFPRVVHIREMYQGLDDDQVKQEFNNRVMALVKAPGIVVFLDESKVIETKLTFNQRTYIPWHMITHFGGDAKLLTAQPEDKSELDGLVPPEFLEKEKKVIKQ